MNFSTSVRLLAECQQIANFVQREAQVLSVTHKLEIMYLVFVKQAVAACTTGGNVYEPELLIKADRIHADAGQPAASPM